MSLSTTTEHAAIHAAVDRALAADPVRGTVFGTIRSMLEDSAWAAIDGDRLAMRSGAQYPVAIGGGPWSPGHVPELIDALRVLPDLVGVSGPPEVVGVVAAALLPDARHGMAQRLFRCDDLVEPVGVAGQPRRAGEQHRELIRFWFTAFVAESGDTFGDPERGADRALDHGVCWLWVDSDGDDSDAVSLAVQKLPTAGSARIGPVYTPPAVRGRGYGSAATAAATRAVLDVGAVPVLFTDLANPTSNKIYQQLGYRPVEDRLVISAG